MTFYGIQSLYWQVTSLYIKVLILNVDNSQYKSIVSKGVKSLHQPYSLSYSLLSLTGNLPRHISQMLC